MGRDSSYPSQKIGMHDPARESVLSYVRVLAPIVCLLAAYTMPAAPDVPVDLARVLKAVETRYNSIKTLELDFEQVYVAPNKARRTETGRLFLRKPGRMRWEYVKPDGKLFVSNGTDYWYYSPVSRRAEKMKLKEAEDLQAPMAFLIGKLDFQRDFGRYTVKREGALVRITAEPRNLEKSPYREVTFLAATDAHIEQLIVTGQDASMMEFRFRNEVRNPAQKDALYIFVPPPGVEVVTPTREQ